MNHWLERFRVKLASQVDGASLAFFRMWFGGCMAVEVYRYFSHGWIKRYFEDPVMTFTLPGFEFLQLIPPPGMYVLYTVLGIAAVCVMLGLFYRVAIVTLFLGHLYIFAIDEANYLNHFYLIALLAFLLIWMPADRVWALGPRRPKLKPGEVATVPYWTIFLLRAQLFIVYFYAGIAKVNADWLQGQPMHIWLNETDTMPIIGPYMPEFWFAVLMSYGGLFYDLSVGFLLLFKKTRLFGIMWSFMFHFMNLNLFEIGIFPWLAMGSTFLYLVPDWPRRVLAFLKGLFVATPRDAKPKPKPAAPGRAPAPVGHWVLAGMTVWLSIQVLMPVRHFLYGGNVSWTEEGHILSWHMKLREKDGELRSVIVENPKTGERIEHDPREILTRRQFRKMTTRPRLVHRYAQWLADRYEHQWGVRPRVYVDLWASLNGRRFQPLIDSSADLAAARMTEGGNSWIVPLSVSLQDRAENSRGGTIMDD